MPIEYRVTVSDDHPDHEATPDGIGFVIECRDADRVVWSVLGDRPFADCEDADTYALENGYLPAANYTPGDAW